MASSRFSFMLFVIVLFGMQLYMVPVAAAKSMDPALLKAIKTQAQQQVVERQKTIEQASNSALLLQQTENSLEVASKQVKPIVVATIWPGHIWFYRLGGQLYLSIR